MLSPALQTRLQLEQSEQHQRLQRQVEAQLFTDDFAELCGASLRDRLRSARKDRRPMTFQFARHHPEQTGYAKAADHSELWRLDFSIHRQALKA